MGFRQDRAAAGARRGALGETGLCKEHHVTVVSVKPENARSFTHADYGTVLTYGSVIAGRPAAAERFVEVR